MKYLANENIPLVAVEELGKTGFDIVSLSLLSPGIDDATVLRMAREQERVLLTFDRDYGELVYRRGLPAPAGIIYMRFIPSSALETAKILKSLLIEDQSVIVDSFIVLDRDGFRRRPLPTA